MAQRPVAISLELPWRISSSVSNLHVTLIENGSVNISADTYWGNHTGGNPDKRVAIEFAAVAALQYKAFYHDLDDGRHDDIDWTRVEAARLRSDAEFSEWSAMNAKVWSQSGFCPDSSVYLIHHSSWPDTYSGIPQHYLIGGVDGCIVLLANGFSWRELHDIEFQIE